MKPPKTESDARAALAAGRAVPLEWLWLLGDAEIVVTNPRQPGRTLEFGVTDAAPARKLPEIGA